MTRVFILGNPRSGTSLFRLMLQQHQAIVAPPEGGFAHWLLPKYEDWKYADATKEGCINDFIRDVFDCKKMETWDLNRELLRSLIKDRLPRSYAELVSLVYQAYTYTNSTEVIIDKNTYYVKHLKDLHRIWPDAHFIHLVRDGRDVASSYLEVNSLNSKSPYRPNLPTNMVKIAQEWQQTNQEILLFLESQKNPFMTIKYEDLVSNPIHSLTGVCDFLTIPFQENMLEYHLDHRVKYQEPKATLDWKKWTKNPLNMSRLGRYKSDLNKEQLNVFLANAQDMLTHFCYE